MKITDGRTAALEGNFDWVLVWIETDAGVSGLGDRRGLLDAVDRAIPVLSR